jgi:hypothetical protein
VQDPIRIVPEEGILACQFPGTGNSTTAVSIALYQGNTQVARLQQTISGGTSVAGVGDAAAIGTDGLYVRSGNQYFSVSVVIPGQQDKANAAAKAIALKILPRLSGVTPATQQTTG